MTTCATPALADEWLSEPELRKRLHYSKSTITRFRKRGMPCIGSDRRRRYHWPSVLAWLAQHA